ncbi:uncharacterized protein SCHCODRAFT_02601797 [Schizophyllum commune H4-8]|uniref:DUF6533 domain-containing protein n=1 Tax=Schizophyllum commune (strain H4-8 / FGSC 9210) TaxID=578458 RepID=D8QEU5_SCHCM|nr:uncharacterized protein SCHCODRAFT_02601797 [Schizophyllum commune H4-8]KAI5888139.1 hypothetical protein SCHCODRAFT_02601797 [Schizophyllum commune H4-8]
MHDERLIADSAFLADVCHLLGVTVLFYDHAITFVPEITRIWCRPKTRGSYLFLLNRYFGFFGGVTVTVLNFCAMPRETCQSVNLFREIYIVVTQIIVSMLMLIRVYAVFSRDRRILVGLLSYAAVGVALAGWALFGQTSTAEPAVVKCLVYTPEADAYRLSVIWLTMLAYDLIVFVLTAGKTARAVRQPRAPPLISILLRDGALYFGVLLISNVANVLTYYMAGPYLKGTLATAVSSLSITLLSRMMLNLHGEAVVGIFSTVDEMTRFTTVAWTAGVATSRMDPYGTTGMGIDGVGSLWEGSLRNEDPMDPRFTHRQTPGALTVTDVRTDGLGGNAFLWTVLHNLCSAYSTAMGERFSPLYDALPNVMFFLKHGLSAQMKLAGLAVQSMLMGIFATLVVAMIYLLSRRPTPQTARRTNQHARRWLILGMSILSMAALGQWMCIVIRSFKAFVFWKGGTHASWFYYSNTGASEVTRSAFHSATIVVADLFVILRLWVVYEYRKRVIVAPSLSSAGLLVSAVGTAYAYAKYDEKRPQTLQILHIWKMIHNILTISTNIYCTGMIIWRIGRAHRRTSEFSFGISIMASAFFVERPCSLSAVTLMAESAALYTSVVLAYQVSYGMNHVSGYIIQDCIPPSAALAAVLVHARAILTRRYEEASEDVWSSEVTEPNQIEVRERRAAWGEDLDIYGNLSVQNQAECSSSGESVLETPTGESTKVTKSDIGTCRVASGTRSIRRAACPPPPCRLALVSISLYTNLLVSGITSNA